MKRPSLPMVAIVGLIAVLAGFILLAATDPMPVRDHTGMTEPEKGIFFFGFFDAFIIMLWFMFNGFNRKARSYGFEGLLR